MSCFGLGKLAMAEGRAVDGVDFLRNALGCAPLCEGGAAYVELEVLRTFTDALLHTRAIDEVETLLPRYREAAKADSDKQGCLAFSALHSLYTSARIHEVPCNCPPRWDPLCTAWPLPLPRLTASCHSFHLPHLPRENVHALGERFRSRQARGRPKETEREVRALLTLMRENEAAVQDLSGRCRRLLLDASVHLKILDPELGEQELIELVALESAKLRL